MTKHDFKKGDKVLIVEADYSDFRILYEDTVTSVTIFGNVKTYAARPWVATGEEYLVHADEYSATQTRLYKDTPDVRAMAQNAKDQQQWQEELQRLLDLAGTKEGANAIFQALPEELQKLAD